MPWPAPAPSRCWWWTSPCPPARPADELAEFVTTETVPAKAALDGRVTDLADLSGRVATVDLLVGEQLLAGRFVRPDDRQAPGTVEVPDGLQEISVLLEPQRVVGARLSAGDTVGVYLSQTLPDGTARPPPSCTRCSSPRCRARRPRRRPGRRGRDRVGRRPPPPATSLMVTLALTAKDAETVVFGDGARLAVAVPGDRRGRHGRHARPRPGHDLREGVPR